MIQLCWTTIRQLLFYTIAIEIRGGVSARIGPNGAPHILARESSSTVLVFHMNGVSRVVEGMPACGSD